MELAAFTELIRQMPCNDQAFETRRVTWESFSDKEAFAQLYYDLFTVNERDAVIISRKDVFLMVENDLMKAIFLTVLWGYPKGYTRPNNMAQSFKMFLDQVQNLADWLSVKKNIETSELVVMLNDCKGVGLSTLSKLMYFFKIKVDGYISLILDAKIISILQNKKFTELCPLSGIREHNKVHNYSKYLQTCTELSMKNGYEPDQLELFLFMFGNNLKQSL